MAVYPNVNTPVSVPEGTPNGTLFVDVGQTYGVGVCDSITGKRVSLEDCARGYWTPGNLSAARASDCEWLVARMDRKIEGVWKINREIGWRESAKTPKKTWPSDRPDLRNPPEDRLACELLPDDTEVKEVYLKIIGKEVHLGQAHNTLRGYFKD